MTTSTGDGSPKTRVEGRRRYEREAPERPRIRMWLFPWLSYLAFPAMLIVLAAMAVTPALVSRFYSSLFVTLALLTAFWVFLAAFWALRRKNA